MNKKRLLKSIIGTVAIYGVLVAFLFILSKTVYLGLGELWIFPVLCAVCSVTAGMLFKGKMYAAVWSAAAVIFNVVVCGFEFFFSVGLVLLLLPLLIPFFIAKAIALSINEEKELSAQTGTTETETQTVDREQRIGVLLKSIIGTVWIYPVLGALALLCGIFGNGIPALGIYVVASIACSVTAGLLFKRQVYAWVWSSGIAILFVVSYIIYSPSSGWDFECFMGMVWVILAPLLIPFFIVKGLSWSWNNTN